MNEPRQLALPGIMAPLAVDPLAAAVEERDRLRAEWGAVCHIAESAERSRLQPLLEAAIVRVREWGQR